MRRVVIPARKTKKAATSQTVAARFSAEQYAKFERAMQLLSAKWNAQATRSEVLTTAVEVLLEQLEADATVQDAKGA